MLVRGTKKAAPSVMVQLVPWPFDKPAIRKTKGPPEASPRKICL